MRWRGGPRGLRPRWKGETDGVRPPGGAMSATDGGRSILVGTDRIPRSGWRRPGPRTRHPAVACRRRDGPCARRRAVPPWSWWAPGTSVDGERCSPPYRSRSRSYRSRSRSYRSRSGSSRRRSTAPRRWMWRSAGAALRGVVLRAVHVWHPPPLGVLDEDAAVRERRRVPSGTVAGRGSAYPDAPRARWWERGDTVVPRACCSVRSVRGYGTMPAAPSSRSPCEAATGPAPVPRTVRAVPSAPVGESALPFMGEPPSPYGIS